MDEDAGAQGDEDVLDDADGDDSDGGDDGDSESAGEDPFEEAQTLLDRTGDSHRVLFIAGVIAAVVIAGIVGYLVGSGGFSPSTVSSAVLSEGQLGDTVASYSFRGARHDVSAQEAIESEYSLSTIQNEDGTYPAPSAETIISYVRNTILLDEAASRGHRDIR